LDNSKPLSANAKQLLQALSANFGLSLITLLAFVAIYPLVLVLMILFRRDKKSGSNNLAEGEKSIEETSLEEKAARIGVRLSLTKREQEILVYLARDRSVRYIAETLVISENTVWTHAKRIYSKVGAHNKQELMSLIEEEL
jgi:DNA-binding NarL/FixJ family response regulator